MHHAHVRRRSGMRHLRNLWLVTGALLLGSVAPAYGAGLANGSFEDDLASWTADPVGCLAQDAVCIVTGADAFTVNAGQPDEQVISVPPLDGAKMVRLGGPFLSAGQTQTANAAASLSQTFTVDPANPALALNYNAFTWDYLSYDELRFTVKVTDAGGAVIARSVQRSYGTSSDTTTLKSTGWRSAGLDLTGYENQQVRLDISAQGTEDQEGGFWAYVDAGTPPLPAVGQPQVTPVSLPGGGPVTINVFGAAGNRWIAVPGSQVAQFPGVPACMPLELTLPIDAGSETVSNVSLLLYDGTFLTPYPMASVGANLWKATIDCVATGDLIVRYDRTGEPFSVPIGGITVVDPAGVVYDRVTYDEKLAQGMTPDQARAAAAITGATVRLQRKVGASFVNVLAGDPGISPRVNPEITGANGMFQWDVSAGEYRVLATADGYTPVTSPSVLIPPPVTNGHIAMERVPTPVIPPVTPPVDASPTTDTTDTTGTTGTTSTPAPTATAPPAPQQVAAATAAPQGPCAGLTGTRLAACVKAENLKRQIAKRCGKLRGKKRAACAKLVRAEASCRDRYKGAAKARLRRTCLRKAKQAYLKATAPARRT